MRSMNRLIAPFVLLGACVLLTGCFGTSITRGSTYGGDYFGDYPYSGTVTGFMALGPLNIFLAPIDIAFDTVSLPVDLVAWPMGYKKNNRTKGLFEEGKYGPSAIDALKRAVESNPNATVAEIETALRGSFFVPFMTSYWEIFRTEENGVVTFGIVNKETKIKHAVSTLPMNHSVR